LYLILSGDFIELLPLWIACFFQNSSNGKPLINASPSCWMVQVGKTYLIERCFASQGFRQVIKLDFLANPQRADIFKENFDPEHILLNIQIALNTD